MEFFCRINFFCKWDFYVVQKEYYSLTRVHEAALLLRLRDKLYENRLFLSFISPVKFIAEISIWMYVFENCYKRGKIQHTNIGIGYYRHRYLHHHHLRTNDVSNCNNKIKCDLLGTQTKGWGFSPLHFSLNFPNTYIMP